MTRHAISTLLIGLLASWVQAQPTPAPPRPVPAPLPLSGPPLAATQGPIVIPVSPVPPPSGFYKSGGVLVGADGYLPFNTGPYLLGGFDGLARYYGSFVMVPPNPVFVPDSSPSGTVNEYVPPYRPSYHGRIFHRR